MPFSLIGHITEVKFIADIVSCFLQLPADMNQQTAFIVFLKMHASAPERQSADQKN